MAERAELEDFFAKRDKKKKSKGKKFESVDIDDVAKVLDAKAKERKKLETYQPPENPDQPPNEHGEDEEWKEVEDDKPDFTGLKIQEFSLADEEIANAKEEARAAAEGANEGPWKKSKSVVAATATTPDVHVAATTPACPPISESPEPTSEGAVVDENKNEESTQSQEGKTPGDAETPAPAAPAKYMTPAKKKQLEEEALKAKHMPSPSSGPIKPRAPSSALASGESGKYIPPGQRPGATPSSGSYSKVKKAMAAPNIDSEEYFPSLGGSGQS